MPRLIDAGRGLVRRRPLQDRGRSWEAPLPKTATSLAAIVPMLCCVVAAATSDARAASLERVEFASAPQRLLSGIPGDRIQGYLAKPDGAGPFPAVVALHGCAGMHETSRQRLADDLVAWGYVILLVDSYTTRGIEQACTSAGFETFLLRRNDAYGALDFLARRTFVDRHRVAAVGFSAGARVALFVAQPNSFAQFLPPGSDLRFRATAAFYPPCQAAAARPVIPTIIFIGAIDDWTPAADCSNRVTFWGNDGPPIELVVYPGAYHGFYYVHLQPGTTLFGHWLEYNGDAADDATRRLHQFLDRYLN